MHKLPRSPRSNLLLTHRKTRNTKRLQLLCELLESRQLMAGDLANEFRLDVCPAVVRDRGNLPAIVANPVVATELGVSAAKYASVGDATPASTSVKSALRLEKPTHFYVADGQQVGMVVHPTRVAVQFDGNSKPDADALSELGLKVVRSVNNKYSVYESAGALDSAALTVLLKGSEKVTHVAPVFVVQSSNSEAVLLDEIIVALKPGVRASSYFGGNPNFGGYRPLQGTSDQFIATVSNGIGEAALATANSVMADADVAWVSPNFYQAWQKFFTPNDARFTNQWHFNNSGQGGGLVDADVDLPEAWDINQGGSSAITIGVVDDGVSIDHPDLDPWTNPGEIAGDSIDNDGNGWVDDIHGWNFVANNASSQHTDDGDVHGTSVAGVAAAKGNNSIGVAGAAYKSRVLSAKIFEGGNVAPDADIATALYYASGRTSNGLGTWNAASIVNNSWGGGATNNAIIAALTWGTTLGRQGAGAAFIFASGNIGINELGFPSKLSLNIPGVVAVGATNNFGELSEYSNFGIALDLVTPSDDSRVGRLAIDTTDRVGTLGYDPGDYTGTGINGFGGTSSSAPLATGIAALVLAQASVLSIPLNPPQLRSLLRNNTDLLGNGFQYSTTNGKNLGTGYGRLNAASAVWGIGKAEISVTSATAELLNAASTINIGTTIVGETQDLTLRVRNQGTSTLDLSSLTLAPGPFTILAGFGDNSLTIGEATSFTVRYTPTAGGVDTRKATLLSNDLDEAIFTFDVTGTAIVPSLGGSVFEDWDGDGTKDAQDSTLSGRTVYIDRNANGLFDSNLSTGTFSNTTPLNILDNTKVISTLAVSGVTNFISDVNVRLNISHTWDADLVITLVAPNGTRVTLISAAGLDGDNFTNTVLDDEATSSVQNGVAPFTGSFRPLQPLSAFYGLTGTNVNGAWSLEINDVSTDDQGILNNWDIVLTSGEQATQTKSNGFYAFFGLPSASYTARTVLPVGWTATGPAGGTHSFTIASAADSFIAREFGNGQNNKFYAQVFNDVDSDGVFDADEVGLAGRRVFLDLDGNGVYNPPSSTTLSNTTATPIPDVATINSTITSTVVGSIADINVRLNITHTWDSDLDVFLIHPDGTQIELFTDVGGSGDNFVNTVLDQQAAGVIGTTDFSTAPFTGTYRPEGNLSLLNGKLASGVWTLKVTDDNAGDTGTLENWDLIILTADGEILTTTAANGTASLNLPAGPNQVRLEPLAGYEFTVPTNGLRSVTAVGAPLFDQRFGSKLQNSIPIVTANAATVSGVEGTTISNAGTWSDADVSNIVTLTASLGTIVKNNNGTWNWSIVSTDNIAATTVTITANDGVGGIASTTFTYSVSNAAPTITRSLASVSGNVLTTIINSGTYADVPADTVTLTSSVGNVIKNANGTWAWSITPSAAINNQTVTITALDEDGGSAFVTFSLSAIPAVSNKQVYYKGSSFASNGDTIPAALDPNKVIAKSGSTEQTLSYTNLINTTRGINGIVLDVAGLASSTLTASDFVLRVSPIGFFDEASNPPSSWATAPAPSGIFVTPGSDTVPARVRLEWADNAIENRWLQIRVLANANTGLTTSEVYYLGHLRGEINGLTVGGAYFVNNADLSAALPVGQVALVGNTRDVDKNGFVLNADFILIRLGIINSLLLRNITIPAAGTAAEGEAGMRSANRMSPSPTEDANQVGLVDDFFTNLGKKKSRLMLPK